MHSPETVLKHVFGYDEFRPLQSRAIDSILARTDTLVILPTGGGKSLCYQIPALIFEQLTVVISPLISLMKDQVEQLAEMGVHAALLNSSLPYPKYRQNVTAIRQKKAKLLYVAPESLMKPSILDLLTDVGVACLAIDEAHCISEWGHDFRPEYKKLAAVRERFPKAVCVALTATATERVRKDIEKSLKFGETSNAFIGSFNRENLYLKVLPKERPLAQVLDLLKSHAKRSGIIYCQSRKQVDELYAILDAKGFSVLPYHAGLTEIERTTNQELFIKDDVHIIIATIAFGMGINKPNVRFVIHYDIPKNIESYYQEIGRAGRDGVAAECVLLFSYGDLQKVQYFFKDKSEPEKRVAMLHLNTMVRYAETDVCRRILLLEYFGETVSFKSCNMCDNCQQEQKEKKDITIAAQKFLSCVKRTGERFGAGHVIDVLRGSKSQKVQKFNHHTLSTYGIGMEYSKKQWFYLSRQFLSKGLMKMDMEYGSLRLAEKAWDVFKGNETVWGWVDEEGTRVSKPTAGNTEIIHDAELFEMLRKKRKELADAANVPPYVVFSDKALLEMAAYFPQSDARFLDIYGVGQAKHEKYGETFLGIIREYCQAKQISENIKTGHSSTATPAEPALTTRRHHEIGELYNAGHTLPDIMTRYNIKQETVLNHLNRYAQEGFKLALPDVIKLSQLPEDKHEEIMAAFERHGTEFLKPVYNAFDGQISYLELNIIRLYYFHKKNVIVKPAEEIKDRVDDASERLMVCLANSRKYSGRCVAGKELLNSAGEGFRPGKWIRPVAGNETSELSLTQTTLQDGKQPRLLDVVSLGIKKPAPHLYQKENFIISQAPWVKKSRLPFSALAALCDPVEHLWENNGSSADGINDRMPERYVNDNVTSSLLLIRPEYAVISVEQDTKLLKRIRIEFSYNRIRYRLAVTDPEIETQFMAKNVGGYLLNQKDIYMCVSISEPLEGYCYKIVAGIIADGRLS